MMPMKAFSKQQLSAEIEESALPVRKVGEQVSLKKNQ